MNEFATVWLLTKLRVEASGRELPHAYTVANPPTVGATVEVTVRVAEMAFISLESIPLRTSSVISRAVKLTASAAEPPTPLRVST